MQYGSKMVITRKPAFGNREFSEAQLAKRFDFGMSASRLWYLNQEGLYHLRDPLSFPNSLVGNPDTGIDAQIRPLFSILIPLETSAESWSKEIT
jgi:hypothetical protein